MSGFCMGLVWQEYPGGGGDFKLALALGDSADMKDMFTSTRLSACCIRHA
jgi:hypothetical protein